MPPTEEATEPPHILARRARLLLFPSSSTPSSTFPTSMATPILSHIVAHMASCLTSIPKGLGTGTRGRPPRADKDDTHVVYVLGSTDMAAAAAGDSAIASAREAQRRPLAPACESTVRRRRADDGRHNSDTRPSITDHWELAGPRYLRTCESSCVGIAAMCGQVSRASRKADLGAAAAARPATCRGSSRACERISDAWSATKESTSRVSSPEALRLLKTWAKGPGCQYLVPISNVAMRQGRYLP
mmetsp:Transcript_25379/g.50624  ORF Transcript_25379/g.50624 Transcript_25379/m.50624 type:complete len:244 (-) Transcript_25379:76-807(-)